MTDSMSVGADQRGVMREVGDGRVELLAGRCASCGRLDFPRPSVCAYCRSDEIGAEAVGPEATLWAWTGVQAAPPGYEGPVPFGFGVVELAGELRVITRIVEPDPARLTYGQPGWLVTEALPPDGALVWSFEPGESS
jgi:uncharacterized OB-fold protein